MLTLSTLLIVSSHCRSFIVVINCFSPIFVYILIKRCSQLHFELSKIISKFKKTVNKYLFLSHWADNFKINFSSFSSGDILRILKHINCVAPFLISSTPDQEYQIFTDAILECSFAGTPGPEIVWRTPRGIILRHNDNYEVDPTAKFQLDQHHRSVLKETIENARNQQNSDTETKHESIDTRIWQGPGITLLENGFLKVHNISRHDSGLYSCFAVNIMGNATKDVRWVTRVLSL